MLNVQKKEQGPRCSLLEKPLKIMKLMSLFLFVAALQVQAKTYSQVTLDLKNVPIEKVFREIKRQTDFLIKYWIKQSY